MAHGTHRTLQVGYGDNIGMVTPENNHIFLIFPQSGKNGKKLEVKAPKRNETSQRLQITLLLWHFLLWINSLNGEGVVKIVDVAIILACYGKCGTRCGS